jgi:hypothetical protein
MTVFAQAPALPLHRAGPYVAAAYIVFLAVILVYVTIMAVRLKRNERELAELGRELRAREEGEVAIGAGEDERESEQAEAMSRP